MKSNNGARQLMNYLRKYSTKNVVLAVFLVIMIVAFVRTNLMMQNSQTVTDIPFETAKSVHFNKYIPSYNTYPKGTRRVDVVIPAHSKDIATLVHCIRGARKYIENVGRVIVVSKNKFTDDAEFFPEDGFPFNYDMMSRYIYEHRTFSLHPSYLYNYFYIPKRIGWYLAQIIKLQVYTIPNLSNDVVVIDADTVFTKPVNFTEGTNGGYFGVTNDAEEYRLSYFKHMECLVPDLKRTVHKYTGIVHHQLMMRDVLQDLIDRVEKHHGIPFWLAFMDCLDFTGPQEREGSEYEIMLNFAVKYYKERSHLRYLQWANKEYVIPPELLQDTLPDNGFKKFGDMISIHAYRRNHEV